MRSLVRRLALAGADGVARSGALELLERGADARPHVLRALTYHRVAELAAEPDLHPGLISATPLEFIRQMKFFAVRFRVVSLAQVIDACRGGKQLPARALLLTFDDGYRDFAENAWPVLRRLGLPVALFVPTGFPDRSECAFWWDRLYAAVVRTPGDAPLELAAGRFSRRTPSQRARVFRKLRALAKSLPHAEAMRLVDSVCTQLGAPPQTGRVLGWEELRALARDGVELAPHGRSHALFSRLQAAELRAELHGARMDLEREIGHAPRALAYPAGAFDDAVLQALGEQGIELGFTTQRGVNDLRVDSPLRLRRITVTLRSALPALRLQLLGWRALRLAS